MRIVFAGTPGPAVPTLCALAESAHEVVAVITRPDAPAGRGRGLRESDVALAAHELGLPVYKPASLRDPDFAAWLSVQSADVAIVVAYGGMIPETLLDALPYGWLNLHFSLLPAWRGAAPVQHALAAGDDITGACVFRIDRELDTGPVLASLTEPISAVDTAESLMRRLAAHGSALVCRVLDHLPTGDLVAVPQPPHGESRAPRITVDDARIRWEQPAAVVERRIRAFTPSPGAWTMLAGTRVKIGPVRVRQAPGARAGSGATADTGADANTDIVPGRVREDGPDVVVDTGSGWVTLGDVTPAGKPVMSAAQWLRGLRHPGAMTFESAGGGASSSTSDRRADDADQARRAQ